MVDQELDALQGQLQRQLSQQQQQQDGSKRPSGQQLATQVAPPPSSTLGLAAQQHMHMLQQNPASDTLGGSLTADHLTTAHTRDASKLADLSSGSPGDVSKALAGGVLGQEEQGAGVVPDVLGPGLGPLLSSPSSLGDIWAAMGGE
jgi:hypothetical protein